MASPGSGAAPGPSTGGPPDGAASGPSAGGPPGAASAGARLPARAPSRAELAERDRFAELAAGSLASVRSSAQAWRNGLAAFLTLVITGFVVVGRSVTNDLSAGWRLGVTLSFGAGLVLALVGLWVTLAAEAGTDVRMRTLASIRAQHGTLTAYEVSLAAQAAARLRRGRQAVALALCGLLTGVVLTWWAPSAAPSPRVYLQVSAAGRTWCGEPRPAQAGLIRLYVPSQHSEVAIAASQVSGLRIRSRC
jgi:hypothetical protein